MVTRPTELSTLKLTLAFGSLVYLRAPPSADAVLLSIRPEDVELVAADMRGDNVRHGVIDQRVFLGEATDVHVMVGTRLLLARAHPRLAAQVGTAIGLALDPAKCVALKAAREPNAVA